MSAVINTMDMQQIEFRAVIKFLTKQGKGPQAILNEMKAVYGSQCPGKTMIYKWCNLFQLGREMIEDKPRALSLKRRRTDPIEPSQPVDTQLGQQEELEQLDQLDQLEQPEQLEQQEQLDQLEQQQQLVQVVYQEQPQQDFYSDMFDDEAFIDEIQNELLDSEL